MAAVVQELLDGINRDVLIQDERLTRVRHPLLEELVGKEVALNTEIHNLITGIVMALSISDRFSNKAQLQERIPHIESILLDSAKDPETFQANLLALKDATSKIAELNFNEDENEVENLVEVLIRGKLKMPNLVQELLIYPPASGLSSGESKEDALKRFENCRNHLLENISGDDEKSAAFRADIESASTDVRAWFANAAI